MRGWGERHPDGQRGCEAGIKRRIQINYGYAGKPGEARLFPCKKGGSTKKWAIRQRKRQECRGMAIRDTGELSPAVITGRI